MTEDSSRYPGNDIVNIGKIPEHAAIIEQLDRLARKSCIEQKLYSIPERSA